MIFEDLFREVLATPIRALFQTPPIMKRALFILSSATAISALTCAMQVVVPWTLIHLADRLARPLLPL